MVNSVRKEMVQFVRNRANHLLVLIVAVGTPVTTMFIKKIFTLIFFIGLFLLVIVIVIYAILTLIELKLITLLDKEEE